MKTVKLSVKELTSQVSKAIGLLGAKKPHAVYFRTRFGIHTFLMKFAIDVLVLDDELRVVKLVEGLKPNNILLWSPRFDKVIELPAGEIERLTIIIGDTISVILKL